MGRSIKIKKGLDIPLEGSARKEVSAPDVSVYGVKPTDFVGVFPKLLINEGDRVKAGTALFYDKYNDRVRFTSPVSGTIRSIVRGRKRVIEEIIIDRDERVEYEDFTDGDPLDMSREQVLDILLASGLWPSILRRPFEVIARPDDRPKAVFISGFDSHPLAPDLNMAMEGREKEFQTGINVLSKLTTGTIHLNLKAKNPRAKAFEQAKNVQINTFKGPHPAGNPGVQINKLDPVNKNQVVWHINPQHVADIGRLFQTGQYRPEKTIALTGSEVKNPQYFKITAGASVEPMLKDNLKNHHVRIISGNPLTGDTAHPKGFVGYYHHQVTVIPEGDHYELMGWAAPGLNKYSTSRTFFSWLFPGKKYKMHTNYNGGPRALVMTGQFENVFPMDIYPMQLLKAVIIEDIEEMENLGIYEVGPEDFALCEFVDTSKTEIQDIIRNGLEVTRKELM